ncbi:fasciclin domain-containing protein [Aspergillus undulatus]|uniref:fasciclin domain-containing protein n=1 Tax=Aspergillus undulatus TaxID=1810928 RepID=UPI003CCC9FBD
MRYLAHVFQAAGLVSLLLAPALAQDDSSSSSSSSSTTATSTSTSAEPTSTDPPLSDAGSGSGGGRFAAAIADTVPPNPRVRRTAFVPTDESFPERLVRQDGYGVQQYLYQVTDQYLTAADLRASTGSVMETLDTDANLSGRGQAVLSHGRREQSDVDIETNFTSAPPVRLYSGLGNTVTILQEDIPYDGGILHIISGPFTRPIALSDSLNTINTASTFTSHISSHLDSLDKTPSITVFVPVNDGLSAALGNNATLSDAEIAALIDSHVIGGTVAYSPLLTQGVTFQTLDGEEVVVTGDSDGEIILNDSVRITQSDIIIANGVVHLIDQPLSGASGTSSTPPTTTTTGDDSVFTGAATRAFQTAQYYLKIFSGLLIGVLGSTAYF